MVTPASHEHGIAGIPQMPQQQQPQQHAPHPPLPPHRSQPSHAHHQHYAHQPQLQQQQQPATATAANTNIVADLAIQRRKRAAEKHRRIFVRLVSPFDYGRSESSIKQSKRRNARKDTNDGDDNASSDSEDDDSDKDDDSIEVSEDEQARSRRSSASFTVATSTSGPTKRDSPPSLLRAKPHHTVLRIKQAVNDLWPGKPSIHGIRLIHSGRVLNETDVVERLCPQGSRHLCLHLVVRPDAWEDIARAPISSQHLSSSSQSAMGQKAPTAGQPAAKRGWQPAHPNTLLRPAVDPLEGSEYFTLPTTAAASSNSESNNTDLMYPLTLLQAAAERISRLASYEKAGASYKMALSSEDDFEVQKTLVDLASRDDSSRVLSICYSHYFARYDQLYQRVVEANAQRTAAATPSSNWQFSNGGSGTVNVKVWQGVDASARAALQEFENVIFGWTPLPDVCDAELDGRFSPLVHSLLKLIHARVELTRATMQFLPVLRQACEDCSVPLEDVAHILDVRSQGRSIGADSGDLLQAAVANLQQRRNRQAQRMPAEVRASALPSRELVDSHRRNRQAGGAAPAPAPASRTGGHAGRRQRAPIPLPTFAELVRMYTPLFFLILKFALLLYIFTRGTITTHPQRAALMYGGTALYVGWEAWKVWSRRAKRLRNERRRRERAEREERRRIRREERRASQDGGGGGGVAGAQEGAAAAGGNADGDATRRHGRRRASGEGGSRQHGRTSNDTTNDDVAGQDAAPSGRSGDQLAGRVLPRAPSLRERYTIDTPLAPMYWVERLTMYGLEDEDEELGFRAADEGQAARWMARRMARAGRRRQHQRHLHQGQPQAPHRRGHATLHDLITLLTSTIPQTVSGLASALVVAAVLYLVTLVPTLEQRRAEERRKRDRLIKQWWSSQGQAYVERARSKRAERLRQEEEERSKQRGGEDGGPISPQPGPSARLPSDAHEQLPRMLRHPYVLRLLDLVIDAEDGLVVPRNNTNSDAGSGGGRRIDIQEELDALHDAQRRGNNNHNDDGAAAAGIANDEMGTAARRQWEQRDRQQQRDQQQTSSSHHPGVDASGATAVMAGPSASGSTRSESTSAPAPAPATTQTTPAPATAPAPAGQEQRDVNVNINADGEAGGNGSTEDEDYYYEEEEEDDEEEDEDEMEGDAAGDMGFF